MTGFEKDFPGSNFLNHLAKYDFAGINFGYRRKSLRSREMLLLTKLSTFKVITFQKH